MATKKEYSLAGLLRAAALLIESRQPASQVELMYRLQLAHGPELYLVRWVFPGVLIVYVHETGELIVQSRPGRLTEADVPASMRARKRAA